MARNPEVGGEGNPITAGRLKGDERGGWAHSGGSQLLLESGVARCSLVEADSPRSGGGVSRPGGGEGGGGNIHTNVERKGSGHKLTSLQVRRYIDPVAARSNTRDTWS